MSPIGFRKHFSIDGYSKDGYITAMYYAIHAVLGNYADFIGETDIARIEIEDGRVVMTTRKAAIKMVYDPQDMRAIPLEILNFGAYEPAETDMALRLIRSGSVFLDVGANIGWYSLNVAKAFPRVKVYAFEPAPTIFALLRKNIELNQLTNITPFALLLSDTHGPVNFFFAPHHTGSSSGVAAATLSAFPPDEMGWERMDCQATQLDTLWRSCFGPDIDFIKCDVEGAELAVLRGSLETIKRCQPMLLLELLRQHAARFGYHPNEVIDLLDNLGYDCFTVENSHPEWLRPLLIPFGRMDENTIETNFFFLHTDKHAAQIKEWT